MVSPPCFCLATHRYRNQFTGKLQIMSFLVGSILLRYVIGNSTFYILIKVIISSHIINGFFHNCLLLCKIKILYNNFFYSLLPNVSQMQLTINDLQWSLDNMYAHT